MEHMGYEGTTTMAIDVPDNAATRPTHPALPRYPLPTHLRPMLQATWPHVWPALPSDTLGEPHDEEPPLPPDLSLQGWWFVAFIVLVHLAVLAALVGMWVATGH